MPAETRPLLHHDKVAPGYIVLVQDESGTIWRATIGSISSEGLVISFSLLGGKTETYRPEKREWVYGFELERLVVGQNTDVTGMNGREGFKPTEFQGYIRTGKLCFMPKKQSDVPSYF